MVFFLLKKGEGSAPTRLFSVSTLCSVSMEVENYVKIFHISEDDEEVSEIRRKQFLRLYYNINKVNASNEKKFHDSAEWIPSSEDVASKFDGGCKKVVVQFEENNFLAFEYLGWDNHAIARSSRVRENFTCVFGYPRNSAQLTPGKGCILTKSSKRFREGTPLEEHFCHG